jgi:hypothetical protein
MHVFIVLIKNSIQTTLCFAGTMSVLSTQLLQCKFKLSTNRTVLLLQVLSLGNHRGKKNFWLQISSPVPSAYYTTASSLCQLSGEAFATNASLYSDERL